MEVKETDTKLYHVRVDLGITTKIIADHLEIPYGEAVVKSLGNINNFNIDEAQRIADLLDMRVNELFVIGPDGVESLRLLNQEKYSKEDLEALVQKHVDNLYDSLSKIPVVDVDEEKLMAAEHGLREIIFNLLGVGHEDN